MGLVIAAASMAQLRWPTVAGRGQLGHDQVTEATSMERTSTLKDLVSRLQEQTMEVAALRAALDVQVRRIIHMQADQDLWPHSPELRRAICGLTAGPRSGIGRPRR
jgi:hypothetical protein